MEEQVNSLQSKLQRTLEDIDESELKLIEAQEQLQALQAIPEEDFERILKDHDHDPQLAIPEVSKFLPIIKHYS